VVECDLAKVEVAGSTPVSRSISFRFCRPRQREGLCSQGQARRQLSIKARYPSGKGEVCKTFMRRFDSDPRLHSFDQPKTLGLSWVVFKPEAAQQLGSGVRRQRRVGIIARYLQVERLNFSLLAVQNEWRSIRRDLQLEPLPIQDFHAG
jgi:hypothetical protein